MSTSITYSGTSHFVAFGNANAYYKPYGYTMQEVLEKIKAGDIFIGAPKINSGETLLINKEGRYVVGK